MNKFWEWMEKKYDIKDYEQDWRVPRPAFIGYVVCFLSCDETLRFRSSGHGTILADWLLGESVDELYKYFKGVLREVDKFEADGY